MQPDIQRRFDAIERQKAEIQNGVEIRGDAQLDWTPNAETWSMRQIVEHLVLGDEVIGQVGEARQEAPMFRILPRRARRALILRALDRDVALPLPSSALEPGGKAAWPELMARWQSARDQMRAALETLPPETACYAHPVLGPLNAAQMLELGESHTAYHMRQIDRLRDNPDFPRQ